MAYVITDECIDVKDGSCTEVCPVDCIYEGGRIFYIHPEECINCGLCLSICPVDAIHWDGEIPAQKAIYRTIASEFFEEVTQWGSPGGWTSKYSTEKDHPVIAAWPVSAGPAGKAQ